jgi:hypothetical protein
LPPQSHHHPKPNAEHHACTCASPTQAHELQQQLASATAELAACREAAEQRSKEVTLLTRALEIRASELGQQAGGQDVPAQLLHALAGVSVSVLVLLYVHA